jgi:Ca2+-binding RTX toxin-like protein
MRGASAASRMRRMLLSTTRRHRWLPVALAATAALGAAATADAATLSGHPTHLAYEGTANFETIAVTPNGTGFAIESNIAITVDIAADPLCSPGGRIVSCVVDRELRVDGDAGGDTITMLPATGGTTPHAAFKLYGGEGGDEITGGALPEVIAGGPGYDLLKGMGEGDRINGDAGDDTIEGGDGADEISGGADGDHLTGGTDGDEIYGGSGEDSITGGSGNDRIGPGLDDDGDVIGGDGVDTIFYGDGDGVAVDLSTAAGHDGAEDDGEEDAIGFENVEGTSSSDTLGGTGGPNTIKGNGGDDTLLGGGGADDLYASDGDDLIVGGDGEDVLMGFSGEDTLTGDGGNDKLYGGEGEGILRGGPGSDLIEGGNGSNTADYSERSEAVSVDLTSGAHVSGGPLDDIDGAGPLVARDRLVSIYDIATGSGDDTLLGNDQANDLRGGGGADTITGGLGRDWLAGEDGTDTIDALDGLVDTVGCGDSTDQAIWDDADKVTGCERRESLSRGGPGDGEEEEQSGGKPGDGGAGGGGAGGGGAGPVAEQPPTPPVPNVALPRLGATVNGRFRTKRGRTTVRRLTISGAVRGTTVTIACASAAKRACPFRQRTVRVTKTAKRLDLTKALRGRVFRRGAVLTVAVGAPGWTSVGSRYAVRAAAAPKRTAL